MGATASEIVYKDGGAVRVQSITAHDDDSDGIIKVALDRNVDLLPTTSYYVAYVPDSRKERPILFRVTATTGDVNIEDCLIDTPGEVGSSALSAHIDNSSIHVPSGGTTGQVLTKDSNADGDVSWTTL